MRVNDATAQQVAGLGLGGGPAASPSAAAAGEPAWPRPESSGDFERCWRRRCSGPALRYDFLMSVPAPDIERLFKAEMSGVLIAEVVTAMRAEFRRRRGPDGGGGDADAAKVLAVLEAITRTGRFGLNSRLVGKAAKAALRELIDEDLAPRPGAAGGAEGLARLRELYGV